MTDRPTAKPLRRGVCPGLSTPMPTGDGLLVRLWPRGTIPLAAFAAFAEAARRHGNGIIEITSRGSVQVRGLSEASAPQFADAIAALGIAAADGIPVLHSPLAGLDAGEIFDSTSLAEELRHGIAQRQLARRSSPKVSVLVDGGGSIDLDAVAADIRLKAKRMGDEAVLHVDVGGDALRAVSLGRIKPMHGTQAVLALLDVIDRRDRHTRARDILAAEGATVFRSAIGGLLLSARHGCPEMDFRLRRNERNGPIGVFALRDGTVALGVGLAFGHADATTLERLATAAEAAGASGLRTAPGRSVLVIGLAQHSAAAFATHAEHLGFIVAADDPRRKVIACAGAPICASAHIAARALAPAIAADAAQFDGTIHISGCAKGCALAGAATLTVVGMADGCRLVANGSVRDAPFAIVPAKGLHAAITDYARERTREAAHV